MNWFLIGAIAFGFLAVALTIQVGLHFLTVYRGREAKRLRGRLQALGRFDAQADGQTAQGRRETVINDLMVQVLAQTRVGGRLELLLHQQRRYKWSLPGLFARIAIAALLGALLLGWIGVVPSSTTLSVLAGLLLGGYVPLALLRHERARRIQRIEDQLPDAIDFIERAMRAGHAFSSAIQMAGAQTPDPLAAEFRLVFEQINYGVALDEALAGLSVRVPSADVNYFVVSVLIQRESGGNLTELLRHVSASVRARVRFNGQLRVLSSEGRISGVVLTVLPFGVGALLYLVNPGFLNSLINDPAGPSILGATGLLMLLGIVWMRQIVKIKI